MQAFVAGKLAIAICCAMLAGLSSNARATEAERDYSPADVFNTLQIYLGSLYVNDFNLFGRSFRVTLQADKDARSSAADLSRLYVRNGAGGMVPLNTLGDLKPIVGPETVPHYNNYAAALINGGAAPGYSSGQAIAAMERAAAAALPADFAFEWTGITFQELKAGSIAIVVFALAIVFVFLILALVMGPMCHLIGLVGGATAASLAKRNRVLPFAALGLNAIYFF